MPGAHLAQDLEIRSGCPKRVPSAIVRTQNNEAEIVERLAVDKHFVPDFNKAVENAAFVEPDKARQVLGSLLFAKLFRVFAWRIRHAITKGLLTREEASRAYAL